MVGGAKGGGKEQKLDDLLTCSQATDERESDSSSSFSPSNHSLSGKEPRHSQTANYLDRSPDQNAYPDPKIHFGLRVPARVFRDGL